MGGGVLFTGGVGVFSGRVSLVKQKSSSNSFDPGSDLRTIQRTPRPCAEAVLLAVFSRCWCHELGSLNARGKKSIMLFQTENFSALSAWKPAF